MTRSSANARIQTLVWAGFEISLGLGNGLGFTISHTNENIITNNRGDKILPSKSPRETRKGRDKKLPIRSLEMFMV
jgi:hypothetical protein